MARLIALVYNWWTLFGRLADPDHHREALTSRPLLLHGIARQTRHAGQTRLTITASHGRLTTRSGRFAELPRSSKTCAKLRSSRPPPNAGAASSAKHSSSISTDDNCGSPLGYRPDETTICDCNRELAEVATSQLLNLG